MKYKRLQHYPHVDGTHYGPALLPYTQAIYELLRRRLNKAFFQIGLSVEITGDILRYIAQGKLQWRHVFPQMSFVGVTTLGIALIVSTFAAMVIALQVATEMARQGASSYVGALVSLAMLRELGPIMTAVAVVAMAGSAYTAELSTMQITKQIDALRVLHVDPIRYLIMPRVVAAVLAMPLLTIITCTSGIVGGMAISQWLADIPWYTFLDSVWQQTEPKDIWTALFKSAIFGYTISILSTTIGLSTQGGAKEVGTATTRAVVWCFVSVALMDYFITFLVYGSE
ncbi:MAG: ABC transporter permease [Cyanobacteria bacterium]|nr:ABC transporter permease [Cyanobacteriota bacterium]